MSTPDRPRTGSSSGSRWSPPAPPGARRTGYRAARPYVLAVAGLVVAALFPAPYLVMLLDALRPSADVLATPPTLSPAPGSGTPSAPCCRDNASSTG